MPDLVGKIPNTKGTPCFPFVYPFKPPNPLLRKVHTKLYLLGNSRFTMGVVFNNESLPTPPYLLKGPSYRVLEI